tara:strand:+ start:1037 stop:1192 length:156 start_codon:yes stop_codon:yes gene_type:complete
MNNQPTLIARGAANGQGWNLSEGIWNARSAATLSRIAVTGKKKRPLPGPDL